MKISKSILMLALSGVAAGAMAAESPVTPPGAFVEKAAQGGMSEIALGKVALKKSQDADVQAFARRMINDHGKANAELALIAKSKSLEVPQELDAQHAAMVETVSGKDGAAFDQAYGAHMNMDHGKAIALFEGAAKSADKDLAGFATKTLPTLKEHKALAQKLPGAATR
jgi:putative membrane protein